MIRSGRLNPSLKVPQKDIADDNLGPVNSAFVAINRHTIGLRAAASAFKTALLEAPSAPSQVGSYHDTVSPGGITAPSGTSASASILAPSPIAAPQPMRGWAAAQLRPQPLAIYGERLVLTDEQFGRVPRTYIETLRDRAVQLPFQRKMQADLPCASSSFQISPSAPVATARSPGMRSWPP